MGLIKAFTNAASSVLADEWKEYFHCDAMSNDELVIKGVMKTSGNNNASTDIISNGSAIAVNEGQMALITEDGKIVDFTAEAGRFVWDSSTEPSCFEGGFFKGIKESFKTFGKRFTFGGDTAKTQRVYYINTKEIVGNKFGTSTPMAYDDPYYKTALYIRYFGQYSFKISDPIVFFSNISGNVSSVFTRESLINSFTDEFMTALDSSLAKCALDGVKFSQLPVKQREIAKYMSDTLDDEWMANRGIQIVSVALAKVSPDDESRSRIEDFDRSVMYSDKDAMAGGLAYAQMQAMQEAAKNKNGSMMGFMGLNVAQNAMGGANAQNVLLNNAKENVRETRPSDTWKCSCGNENSGKFCSECGAKKPETAVNGEWICECGNKSSGKFCSECGKKRPVDEYRCECGYVSKEAFKFCPECGKRS
ncbi:MAG: SPFH domain-containing protein [Ruminococcaceae bacterium]|nr:SPFH domain-containing protein [Oscillospiraceae bacterium]